MDTTETDILATNELKHPKSFKKRYLVFFFTILIFTISLDLSLQAIYKIIKGEFTWKFIDKIELFQIEYLEPVSDERYIVPKKSYKDQDIEFDEYGFRLGSNKASTTNKNIVFLGDSIFFGYKAKPEETIPSRLSELYKQEQKDINIINAAVPSYSLNQAVYKYIYEIENVFPVSTIVLQVYDPAANFFRMQHNWDVSQNWYTTVDSLKIGPLKKYSNQYLRYSSLFYLYWRNSGKYYKAVSRENVVRYNNDDLERYKNSIIKSLDTLVGHAKNVDKIVLMPIVRPKKVMDTITQEEKLPLEIINNVFREYPQSHEKVVFLDTQKLIHEHQDEQIFIDLCCHLTSFGLNLEAEYIKNFLDKPE